MRIYIQEQGQFGQWRQFTTKHNERDAYRVTANRASSTGKRHRLVTDDGQLIDLVDP